MAHLPKQFDKALENIEPTELDKTNASAAHGQVRRAIEGDEELVAASVDTVLIGSYARQVSIRRMKDVDVFSEIPEIDESVAPEDLLDKFEKLLADSFGKKRVKRRTRTVEVDFPDYDLFVDAVPARPADALWEIPDRHSGWVVTNPTKLGELTTAINQVNKLGEQGMYVPTVKLIRQIRRANFPKQPAGVFFEILAYWSFNQGVMGASVADYLTNTLLSMTQVLESAIPDGLK
jgi:hypothetical protein